MQKLQRRALLAILILSLASTFVVQAGTLRLYGSGTIPNPCVVARILSHPNGHECERAATRGRHVDPDAEAELNLAFDLGVDVRDIRTDAAPAAKYRVLQKETASATHDDALESAERAALPASDPNSFAILVDFADNSSRLPEDAPAALDAVAEGIKLCGYERKIVIESHSAATGSAARDVRLSQRRAETVKRYLVDRHGIPERVLVATGLGANAPINREDRSAAENNRVQFRSWDA
jgi:outer membrane protein OmpA-like peptidoglycan-associated protein